MTQMPQALKSPPNHDRARSSRRRWTLWPVLVLLSVPSLGQLPWKDRFELVLPSSALAPTSAERLASAEVLIVHDYDMYWNGLEWELSVIPWTTWNGAPYDGGDCTGLQGGTNATLPICSPTEPFYGQPTPGQACTGILVAPNKVVTAGHCVIATDPEGGCANR